MVAAFEERFAAEVGARYAVAVSSGTAALHAAVFAAGIGPGDEVVTTPLTFAATANCVLYQGGRPVFADVDPETLNLDPGEVERLVTPRTKAVIAVHFAGHPCDVDALHAVAERRGLTVIEDCCHALGAEWRGRRVGGLSPLNAFSFHPAKHITTGEGGMVTTNSSRLAERLRVFRNHGLDLDQAARQAAGTWAYDMVALGWNYRLTDFQCALGLQQLTRLNRFLSRRRRLASRYLEALADLTGIALPVARPGAQHAWHLFVIQVVRAGLAADRDQVFAALRAENIGANVHYRPVHLLRYYRERLGTAQGLCPRAEAIAGRVLSLPLFPKMTDDDADDVIAALRKVIARYRQSSGGAVA
jgi:dTDP-4-amino-4,6-dideoxygalactose transaminase